MSTSSESGANEFELDLDLHFLPAWAKQPPAENKYAKFEGDDRRMHRGDRSDRRDQRRDRPPRRDQDRGGQRGPGQRPAGGPRHGGGRFEQRGPRFERPEAPPPPKIDLDVSFIPEDRGVESLARQIRLTGRAYPLFDIAFLILKKPDRYNVCFSVVKKPDGQIAQPLFVCGLDDTLWLSEREATDYILDKHFSVFYQPERTPTDPPKGTYTFVAQCGMSGTILGPPNYHDYQNKLRKLHAERFSRMPFEAFKARIKIVRDEAIVKKWLDEQSWKTEYIVLNVPEQIKLSNREEVEKHFKEVHMPNVIKSVESHTVSGVAAQSMPARVLQSVVRRAWDDQMRFPLRIVTTLSQQFAGHGLQFFKVNKTVTHVAVARPRYLDTEITPVSDGVNKIVEFIRATPRCSRRKILEALVPGQVFQPNATPEASTPTENLPPSPEAAAVISDLHWLIHQGHVIEFANGLIELAKKPLPRPPKPEPAPKASPPDADAAVPETPAAIESKRESDAAVTATEAEIAVVETAQVSETRQEPAQPSVEESAPQPEQSEPTAAMPLAAGEINRAEETSESAAGPMESPAETKQPVATPS